MQHRIAFAREQRIHAHASLVGHLLKAASFQFVRNKHVTLLLGQLVERQFQLIKKHTAEVESLGPGIGRWQQILNLQSLAAFVLDRSIAECP